MFKNSFRFTFIMFSIFVIVGGVYTCSYNHQSVIGRRVLDGKPEILYVWKYRNIGDTITYEGIRYVITKTDK